MSAVNGLQLLGSELRRVEVKTLQRNPAEQEPGVGASGVESQRLVQGGNRFPLVVLCDEQPGLGELGRPVKPVQLLVGAAQQTHHRLVVAGGLSLNPRPHHQRAHPLGELAGVVDPLFHQELNEALDSRLGGPVIPEAFVGVSPDPGGAVGRNALQGGDCPGKLALSGESLGPDLRSDRGIGKGRIVEPPCIQRNRCAGGGAVQITLVPHAVEDAERLSLCVAEPLGVYGGLGGGLQRDVLGNQRRPGLRQGTGMRHKKEAENGRHRRWARRDR